MIIQISQEYYEQLKQNVERGAQFLDEQNPQWFNRVDLKNLALSDCTRCVLGCRRSVSGMRQYTRPS